LRRTTLDGTNPLGLVYTIDVKYSPNVFFLNETLVFYVTNPPWILGVTYTISMTQGVGTADLYCGTEYAGFGIKLFSEKIYNIYC
jgi:hypothetical protein